VIVHLLEKGDATLEESIQIFEEGLELVAHCDSQLKAFDQKLQDVLQKHQKGE
jgi:exodeoxyribonuclease VII small subunit